jgi:two-component system, sensor histidine kinase PdtaS
MDADRSLPSTADRPWFARLTTGGKAFLILSIALLPLALIGVFAVLQTTRVTEESARSRLRVAAVESGRRLAIELQGDANALRSAIDALVLDPADMPSCARVTGVFAAQFAAGTRFSIRSPSGTLTCGLPVAGAPAVVRAGEVSARIVAERGLLMTVGGARGARADVLFPTRFLERISRPSAELDDLEIRLMAGDTALTLRQRPETGPFERRQQVSVPIGTGDLVLQMTLTTAPIGSSTLVALLLPLLMWAAAAGLTWFAVDRLFIGPIRQLNASIASYRPGEVIRAPVGAGAQASEIGELYQSFVRLSRTVVDHEAELAEGLVRQTKLTREVHHRVKNNLQVIASLINFHARGASVPEAAAAYASIQRRVDALAVVHRNHFAEMEVNRGLGLRSMISELSANIRATAPDSSSGLGITLEIAPFLVSQDTAVAVAFLVTELVELAMSCQPAAQIRISARADGENNRAILRVISSALVESDALEELLLHRYGRVIEGLSRQLRAKLHHDPLTGAYEISFAVLGVE